MDESTIYVCRDCADYVSGIDASERGTEYPHAVTEAFARDAAEFEFINGCTLAEHAEDCAALFEGTASGDECDCGAEDGHFSWHRCPQCGSTLGGDRMPVTYWNRAN